MPRKSPPVPQENDEPDEPRYANLNYWIKNNNPQTITYT